MIPPLALTHAKYAPAMFSMSLKSVPGCLVLIAPMLIGVPVAATPGFVPHEDVETVPALAELDAGAEAEADDDVLGAADELLELELELHAASTPSDSAATAAAAVRLRQWTGLFMGSAFSWLTTCHFFRTGAGPASRRGIAPAASRKKSPFTGPQVNGASLHCLSNVV